MTQPKPLFTIATIANTLSTKLTDHRFTHSNGMDVICSEGVYILLCPYFNLPRPNHKDLLRFHFHASPTSLDRSLCIRSIELSQHGDVYADVDLSSRSLRDYIEDSDMEDMWGMLLRVPDLGFQIHYSILDFIPDNTPFPLYLTVEVEPHNAES